MRAKQGILILTALTLLSGLAYPQESSVRLFLSDSSLLHASVSICIKDADNGETIVEHDSGKSLTPASVLKLITSGTALEMLGPQHDFRTIIGYSGSLNKRTGRLSGNIIMKGGGDPALGSDYFPDHYQDFINKCVSEIRITGIRRISGKVIADDSYYDYLPVPSGWQWEDLGNYYGAGVYGLSVFDNSVELHLNTGDDSSRVIISGINPPEYVFDFENLLTASGESDEGYIFAAPYSTSGWIEGTVPVHQEDFVLRASITDPPLFLAILIDKKLEASGITVREVPSTARSEKKNVDKEVTPVLEISSPPLSEIIEVLNHESVNLYAETLLKELGKRFRNIGSTAAGIDVVKAFLLSANIRVDGMFIEDGSGLSSGNAISSEGLTNFLIYMKNHGKYFNVFLASIPEAGKEGTLRYYFRDPVFETRINAKSGSMERVRCYAGYFTTKSERTMAFSILVNNYTGPVQQVISSIEEIIKEIILYK